MQVTGSDIMDSAFEFPFGEPEAKRRRCEDDVTLNLQHLFSNTYLSSQHLYSEICSLQQQLALHQQQKLDSDASVLQALPMLPDLLESALSTTGRAENLLTPQACVQRLVEVTKEGAKDADTMTTDVRCCLLMTEQRVKLDIVKSLLKALKEQQPSRWAEVISHLTKEVLPLEVLWHLHVDDILPLPAFLDSALRDREQCTQLTEQLLQLCCARQQDHPTCHQIVSVLCSHLVKIGFPEKKSEDTALRKACIGILDGVTRGLLDGCMSKAELLLHTDLLSGCADISHVSFKKFCTHTISLIMSHRPNMKVSEALKRQKDWKSGKIPSNLKTLYKQLLVPFDSGEVLEMLRRILEKQEVNWQMLLSCMATFLICFPSAATDIQDHVARLLASSLESGDMENSIVAFLLVRQSCAEGAHVFPAYPHWFLEMFGDSARSPAASKKSFTFLMKFLTDLVPFEPADILKVHILRPPFIPAKCRDLWTDYTLLAKTRLADLNVSLEETNTAIYADQGNSATQGMPGLQDVEKAVAAFESSGKVPTTVMEASIFRKPYFVGKFLPALLRPRHLPDIPDSRMKFIEALKRAGKIPSSLFSKYEDVCRRETRQLLEGVFEVEGDDGVEEMMMAPQEQLKHRLKQLTDAIISQSTETRVSEIVSVVSEKIEVVIGTASDSAVTSGQTECVIDMCQPALLPTHVQVVDEVLNCVCPTLHSCKDTSQQAWLHQLVRMLSQHCTLHPALFVRLLTLFSDESMNCSLSDHHIEGTAAFVFHLSNNWAQFPPLFIRRHDSEEKQEAAFLPVFLSSLPASNEAQMLLAHWFLTAYLTTAFLCLKASSAGGSQVMLILPPRLLVLFTLLSWRLLPETQPTHPQAPSDLPPQPQMTRGREPATSETAGRVRKKAAASALYVSEKFQELLKASEPTLEDWLDFELKVAPALDVLQPLQRQMYHYAMISHFCMRSSRTGPSEPAGVDRGLPECCFLLMRKLVVALGRSQTASGKCPRCQNALQSNAAGSIAKPGAVSELLTLLAKLTQSLPTVSQASVDGRAEAAPWLVQQVFKLVMPSSSHAEKVVPEAVLRVVLSCPSHLLFSDCPVQGVTEQSIKGTIRLLEEFLVTHAAEGGIVPLDIICHLLQGYLAVIDRCIDRSVLKAFEDHPLIVLSTLVHWHSVCVLVPSLPVDSLPWNRLPLLLAAVDRFFTERRLSAGPTASGDPFCLAAAAFAALVHRDWFCEAESRTELVCQLHQTDPQTVSILSELLLTSLSDGHCCSAHLSSKAERRLSWLSEIWRQFPQLIQSAGRTRSDFPGLSSADCLPFREVAILRCVRTLRPDCVGAEKGVAQVVVHLFARLCQRFEDTHTSQQTAEVGVVLELSETVLAVVRAASWDCLQTLDAADVKQCGLEVCRLYHQRVKNRV